MTNPKLPGERFTLEKEGQLVDQWLKQRNIRFLAPEARWVGTFAGFFTDGSNSLSQTYTHRRENWFSPAASLEAFESIKSTTEISVDGCLIAKNSVESIAIRNGMPPNGNLPYIDPSPRTQRFEKSDSVSY
jgi:hypothetical protein